MCTVRGGHLGKRIVSDAASPHAEGVDNVETNINERILLRLCMITFNFQVGHFQTYR